VRNTSYTLNGVRRIPDGLQIDAKGAFWITAVAAGGVDVID
jgi:sugar lactone lactonase YvrE